MNEREYAVGLAGRVLDRMLGDPDDDLVVLSRQLLRSAERERTPPNTHDVLQRVVDETRCFPNWRFRLQDDAGALRLIITIRGHNNYAPDEPFVVSHAHPVPITTYNEKSWRRWILEQCLRTMNHELGEALRFGDVRPFVPMHGPGEDPYTVHEWRSEEDARTAQDGSRREGSV